MHKQLSNFAEIRIMEVDGSTNETPGVDMANYDGVLFILRAHSASLDVKAIHGDAVHGTSGLITTGKGDVKDSQITADAQDEVIFYDVYRPGKRYVGLDTGDDGHVSNKDVFALRYHARNKPVNNEVDDTIQGKVLIDTETGTA